MAWIAGTHLAWLALASQSMTSFSSGPALARVARAFSRSATCSSGSCEKKASMMCPRANCGSACTALRKFSRPSAVCSISILAMAFSKNTCACGDLVEICMPVGVSCANALSPKPNVPKVKSSAARMEPLMDLICCNSLSAAATALDHRAPSIELERRFVTNGCHRPPWLVVALEKISLLQWELAVDFQNIHAAVDGINVHQTHSAGNGLHRFQTLSFRVHENHGAGMRRQQRLKLLGLHVVKLFNRSFHLRRVGVAKNKDDRPSIWPLMVVKLEYLGQVCCRQSAHAVGLVHNYRNLLGFT